MRPGEDSAPGSPAGTLAAGPLRASVVTLGRDQVGGLEPEWRALEQRSLGPPYLTWDWLAAWALVYEPEQLSLARVQDNEGRTVALGLIERQRLGRWRFAGAPVTPVRGLLCDREAGDAPWRALSRHLAAEQAGCWLLDGEGLTEEVAPALAGALRPGAPVYGLDLPGSFDDYLAQRTPTARKGLKQKLRRLQRVHGRVQPVDPAARRPALLDFVDLHRARARAKGAHHPGIDRRLAALLQAVADSRVVSLRLFELMVYGSRAGVTVRIDCESTAYFYNAGIDPSRGWMGPGLLLELGSIADAIERGFSRFDLGPGAYRYKSDLGGRPSPRYELSWTRSSLEGRLLRAAGTASPADRGRARAVALLHRLRSRRRRPGPGAGGGPTAAGLRSTAAARREP